MIFSLKSVLNSLATLLSERYPNYPVYDSPNQQGTKFPCFFIFFTSPVTIEPHIGSRMGRDLVMDIVFVQQRNIVDRNAQIYEVAEFLDASLERFMYRDSQGNEALIRTEERQWHEEDDELHYQFHIRQRVSLSEDEIKMQEMEENYAGIKKT